MNGKRLGKAALLVGLVLLVGASCDATNSSSQDRETKAEKLGATQSGAGVDKSESAAGGNEMGTDLKSATDTKAIPDYPKEYCAHVGKLALRTNVDEELSYFCVNGQPTKEMIAFRERLLKSKGKYEVTTLIEKHNTAGEITEMMLLWGYYVSMRPFEVKARPLYQYITKNLDTPDIRLNTVSERSPDSEVDHGLHLWSAKMTYDLSVTATDGSALESKRGTEYNMYQVLSASEEMGFGVETLTDKDNPDYKRSVLMNLSFNDGTGYNDGVGGAIVMNILHIVMNDRGFPETAASALQEIGKFMAGSMHDGLKE